MKQAYLLETIPCDKYDLLTKEDVVVLYKEEELFRLKLQKENKQLREQLNIVDQKSFLLGEQYVTLKNKIFGKSSEKSKIKKETKNPSGTRGTHVQLPSERYPNIPLIESEIELDEVPECKCCCGKMEDSGMWETSESLTVIPKKYQIIKLKRKKYRCRHCHGDIKVTPAPARILPGSSYSDEMILDVSLSKYCDLIPIDRYAAMASRESLVDLPPNSLINLTHQLAFYVLGAYLRSKQEVKASTITKADETPQRMLEGNGGKKSWYLWGFSTATSCYFDIRDTRSGDVASEFLKDSNCLYLMTDRFSGYQKAITDSNEYRREHQLPEIIGIYCNAHARRYFLRAEENFPKEALFFIRMYRRIYHLERMMKETSWENKVRLRKWMMIYGFSLMENRIIKTKNSYSKHSSLGKAMRYFYNNYKELTLFTSDPNLPIDNNSQEALLRSPVVGRKTWYGTHSKQGAETAAILFTLVEGCKLNKVNPREYFMKLISALHRGDGPLTPSEFKALKKV